MTASLPPVAPAPAPAPAPSWSEPGWAPPGGGEPAWSEPGWSEPGWSQPAAASAAEPDVHVGGWGAALGNAGLVPNPAVWTTTAPEPDAPDGGWRPPPMPAAPEPERYPTGPTVEQAVAASGWPSHQDGDPGITGAFRTTPAAPAGDPGRPALARRRPGGQHPGESMLRIPRGEPEAAPAPTRSPEDIHRIVSSFTAGVEQGRLRGREPGPPPPR
jgi:hypothetical protein